MLQFLLRYCVIYLRWAGWCVLFGAMLVSMLLLTLRYWLLPDIGKYRNEIAMAISQASGQKIDIDGIHANWTGLRPHLLLHGVRVFDSSGNPAVDFPQIQGTVSWRSVLHGELNFHEIVIDQPALFAQRDADGYLNIAGAVLNNAQQENSFLDWLLRQRRLIINQATIYWQDDLRDAPLLYLESVSLRLQNGPGGKRHRFGLRAVPPKALAAPVDIRGDIIGNSISALSTWQGRLFVRLQDVDLNGLQNWITLPSELTVKRGRVDLRAWVDVDAGNLAGWAADISLQDGGIRFAQHLPLLEIDSLHGRLGKKRIEEAPELGEVWYAHHLSVGLSNRPITHPATIEWQVLEGESSATDNNLRVEALDVGVFASLVAALPVEDSLHKLLSELSPEGIVELANINWQGTWSKKTSFGIKGSFNNIALQSFGGYPSFRGVSGNIDTTERNGVVNLISKNLEIGKAKQLEEKIRLSSLAGQFNWEASPDREVVLLNFDDVTFSSEAGSGSMAGRFTFRGDMPGNINLKGNLAQADLSHIKQYIGWIAGKTKSSAVNKAAINGSLTNAKFEVQGALNGNSSNNEDRLALYVETNIQDAVVKFSDDWPSISNIAGKLFLQDDALEIALSAASFSDIDLQDITLQFTNLYTENTVVQVKGAAEGDASEMVALIQKSPLGPRTGELLKNTTISGKGRLQLDMTLPMKQEDLSRIKMAGRFQFMNNRIDFGRYVPDLEKISGAIDFTESSMAFDKLHAQALGGPVEIYTMPLPDGSLRITANGRANFDRLQPDAATEPTSLLQLWARFLKGGTDWQAMMDIERGGVSIVAESLLEGMESALPAPFSKTAMEVIPVRFEKHFVKPQDDLVRFSYGQIVSVELERIREKAYYYHPVRGAISFGGVKIQSGIPGTQIHGAISKLEWDQWRDLIKLHGEIDALSGHVGRGLDGILTESTQFDLRIGELEFLGGYFNDSTLAIDRQNKIWKIHVASKEIVGMIDWYEAIPQRVVARLSKLVMPESAQESIVIPRKQNRPRDWPAVDIEAEELVVKEKLLGRLKLEAAQKESGWEIEKLAVEHSDSSLQAKGIWQNRVPPFRVRHNFLLESGNVGKFLKRHGYQDRIARGEGELAGSLEWVGSKPFSIDFPSLTGDLELMIQRGQFPKLKPGIGKLLGIFDLKSLPRRLTLDFYDIFGKGFGFDYFHGNINIRDGIATSNELHVTGSAADLAVSGELDLVKETQSLNLKVFPSLGLVTPVAGIAAMIATQSLQDPFDRVLLSEYAITGSWSAPVVIRLDNNKGKLESPVNQSGNMVFEVQD